MIKSERCSSLIVDWNVNWESNKWKRYEWSNKSVSLWQVEKLEKCFYESQKKRLFLEFLLKCKLNFCSATCVWVWGNIFKYHMNVYDRWPYGLKNVWAKQAIFKILFHSQNIRLKGFYI